MKQTSMLIRPPVDPLGTSEKMIITMIKTSHNRINSQLKLQVNHHRIHHDFRSTALSPRTGENRILFVSVRTVVQTLILDPHPPQHIIGPPTRISQLSCDSPPPLQAANPFNRLQDRCKYPLRIPKQLLTQVNLPCRPLYILPLPPQVITRCALSLCLKFIGAFGSSLSKKSSYHSGDTFHRPRGSSPSTGSCEEAHSHKTSGSPLCSKVKHRPCCILSVLLSQLAAGSSLLKPSSSSLRPSPGSFPFVEAFQFHFQAQPSFSPPLHHSSTPLIEMAENNDLNAPANQPENQVEVENVLSRVINNNSCTLCKTHSFMIARFVKHFNELKEDFQADSRSKRKKLEKQQA